MPLNHHFLDFSQPALSSAAEYLVQRYQRGSLADMTNAIVVLPGRRAARRLLEILVELSLQRGLLLSPPTLETVGQLPEHLYQAKRPFASGLTQQLAWAGVLRDSDRKHLLRVVAAPTAPDDMVGWLDLAQSVSQLHTELAADVLDFRDVDQRGRELETFGDGARWAALRRLQEEYLKTLDALQLWDVQTARLVAIAQRECQTDRDIVVLGAVDMPRTLRQMLEQIAERVTVLVHAPSAWADRFDDDGCLVPNAWATVPIPLDADLVRVVDGPAEVADMAARCLAGFDGRYRADEITIGLADEKIAPYVSRQLQECGIAARTAVGTASSQTAPYRLLAAIEAYLRSRRYGEFAALVRHPDVSAWIGKGEVAADWLERLDEYFSRHLQARLSGDWLGDDARTRSVRQVYDRVEVLLQRFQGSARPWPAWNEAMRKLLLDVYGDRVWDREHEPDRVCLDVFGQIHEAFASAEAVPSVLIPMVDAATAIQLTLRQLRTASVSSRFDPEAIELLGWLELPLDDAPALVVCSFSEGFVPSSVNADAFLPNALRSRLGLQDNARRYARDAYALSVLAASRQHLDLIVARHDSQGDPLSPSRLLFATERDQIARRARRFFAPPPSQRDLPPLAGGSMPGGKESAFVVSRPKVPSEKIRELPVTAFRDYLACPYRFYLRRILKLQSSDDAAEELDGGLFGSLIHEVLRQFGLGSSRDSTDPEEIRQQLRELLQHSAEVQFGRHPLASVLVQLEQLRLRLDGFADKQAERAAAGWSIESTEGEQREHTDAVLKVGTDQIILRGRIDRIDIHRATGRRAILDYKSSDSPRSPEKAHQRGDQWIDLQLPLYRHLARSLGITGPVELGYVLLPKDVDKVEFCMAQWTEDQLEAADDVARDVVSHIWNGDFWPPTDPAPDFSEEFAAICQDGVFERRLAPDPRILSLAQRRLGFFGHPRGGDSEPLVQLFERSRSAESGHADKSAARADIAIPALPNAGFDRDPRGDIRRQHAVAVRLVLFVEQLPARQADDPRLHALGGEILPRFDAQRQFAAGADQDDVGAAVRRVQQDVATLSHARRRAALRPIQRGHVLPGEDQRRGTISCRQDLAICFGDFVRVSRTKDQQAGDAAAGRQVFDRLVRRAVFAQADGIVRQHVQHALVHDGAQPHRRPHVIGEHKERAAVRP